jgi:hypothetical protein
VEGPLVTWKDRIVVDGLDRDAWLAARRNGIIGASDAAKFAKASSVDKYLAAKLTGTSFSGNAYTEQGHRWEPLMLAYAGIPQNLALIHSPAETGFAATPDGLRENPDGSVTLAECKAKHGKVVDGPNTGEWRQLAWQFEVVPEANTIEFLWVELVQNARGEWDLRAAHHGIPHHLVVTRDHPKIVAARELIVPIATDLLPRLRVALSYERSAA